MPAPSLVQFHTPGGVQMPDGFSTKVVFALMPTCPFWEITPQIGGIDGGELIKISSMRNTLWHTAKFRTLLKAEDTEVKVSFDPRLYNEVKANLINRNTTVSEWFPDGSTLTYFGGLRKMGKMSMSEGELPTTDITISKTNIDPSDNQTEYGPVMSPAAGT